MQIVHPRKKLLWTVVIYEASVKYDTAFFRAPLASSIAMRACSKLPPSPASEPFSKLFIESKSAVPAVYEREVALDIDCENDSTATPNNFHGPQVLNWWGKERPSVLICTRH